MKVKGEYEGCIGFWLENGKRFIATPWGWTKIRRLVRARAKNFCEACGIFTPFGDVHHKYGRGGGKRDDRLENLSYLCRKCHENSKIERRYASTTA